MKNSILTITLLLLALPAMLWAATPETPLSVTGPNEFGQLMKKIRQDFTLNPDEGKIEKDLQTYHETDGSFTDIDYASIQRTNWPPLEHINRLYDFAFAYTHPQNRFFGKEELFEKIEKGLEYWHERNPWCHNWWYNQIAEPQKLGILLIQMRTGKKQLPAELEQKILERIKKDGGHPAKWTGANRTDIALHWIYRACLTENQEDLALAVDNVYNPITYTTREGFQHDNSYFQHGQQLYIGGYGDEILKGITQVAMYTQNTRYAIPHDKLALLSKFMRETYYQTIRGKYMLFDVLGRGVSRPQVTDKSYTALFAARMMELDKEYADEYRAIIARMEGKQPAGYSLTPTHTHYFRGDYTLHVRPHYTFDVRMVSTRTMRCEYGNGENLKTYFMSDGCTNIVTAGNEYADIFPVWNWARIPGTTAPQMQEIPMAASDWQTPGTSTFAGGVSDGRYGVSAYTYMDNYAHVNTGAHKAWFFFDDEVVCLGAGIHSTADQAINTTINQCLSSDEKQVLISEHRKTSLLTHESSSCHSPEWILHDSIAYLFPEGGELFIHKQWQEGSWHDINRSAIEGNVRKQVFTLGFDHGKRPTEATYAYIVVPGKDAKSIKEYNKKKQVAILENTSDIQAVNHKQLGLWGIVFHHAGEFNHKGLRIAVDKPCILMVKQQGKHTTLHIADPTQSETNIQVTLSCPARKAPKTIDCDFKESGIYAGATRTYTL
ncbi:polysaccharide lyase 8 family protein [uncultured Phocaeicola sp.]|uniref:polysaccharide lyase 8 family protein n=1 Tax=uncultured Phocaeicola sp. TaxID=990718 RepID=UPI0014337502|nr:polysaccharide lyase 8 family protein [uncultured Phocaeicola sp.]GFI00029.1 chondroitinase-AC [Bacteroidaceae bacterium]